VKNSQFKVAVALGTLIATGTTSFNVQALVPEANFERRSTPTERLVAQARTGNELFQQANELLGLGEYDDALAVFEQGANLNPPSFSAWYWRGYTLSKLERFTDAVTSFNEAIEIKPDYVLALYEKGNALYKLGRYQDALTSCEQGLRIDSDNYQLLSLRGLALHRLNRKDDAIASLETQ
jgi:tetratricopeptide (TPR) repeat protein